MDSLVSDFVQDYLDLWNKSKKSYSDSSKECWFWVRLLNQRRTSSFSKNLYNQLEEIINLNKVTKAQESRILALLRHFAQKTLGYVAEEIDIVISKDYFNVTKSFISRVKDSYPGFARDDIFQALRNVWIMSNIQCLLNRKVELTPSVFAYSMLYPFSDNYLDDTSISISEKKEFNNRFGCRLAGDSIEARNDYEENIFALIKMIEGEYARDRFPEVFQSLLAIHQAQENSLLQQKKMLSEQYILELSISKGGTSVLADAYLVNGALVKKYAYFFFGYGVLLQLMDDLQDAKNDLDNGHQTIFSKGITEGYLDDLTDQLLCFMTEVINQLYDFEIDIADNFARIIDRSCFYLILDSIAQNKNFYSKNYLRSIEKYSKLYFIYQNKLRRKIKEQYSRLSIS